MPSKRTILIASLSLLLTSCAVRMNEALPTPTASFMSATFPATLNPAPSETPLAPPPQPTRTPVAGSSSTQINVRAEPSTGSNVLGILPANTNVEILGKDPGGNWYQINYAQASDGKGWVNATYVTIPNGVEIPQFAGDESVPNSGNVAIVQQQLNVRSGPGTSFNSLGTLNPQDVVNLIGKDSKGTWLQIEFSSGPDGKGWVNAAFVQAHGAENIPIVVESGEVVGTGTPTAIPFTPTPTVLPAWDDGDSQNNPIVNVVLDPAGTSTFAYSGDVSTPEGDAEDWVQFSPFENAAYVSLTCDGSSKLQIDVLENGQPTSQDLHCGTSLQRMDVKAGSIYLLHFEASPGSELQFIRYTITIQMSL